MSPSKALTKTSGSDESHAVASTTSRRLSLRRPSGYLSQRKSIGGAAPSSIFGSRKLAGRASMAQPGTADAWSRFDPQQPLPQNIPLLDDDQIPEDHDPTDNMEQEAVTETPPTRPAPAELFVYQDPEPSITDVTSSQETEIIPEDEAYADDRSPEDETSLDVVGQHGDSVEEEVRLYAFFINSIHLPFTFTL
jgi:hypothetical protein